MFYRFTFIILNLIFFTSAEISASDQNSTTVSRVEIIVTLAGVQETISSIENSSRQISALTRQLSNKEDFTSKDHELISGLTTALNNNANAINNIAATLPKQFEKAEDSINNILDNAVISGKQVVSISKSDLIDPTLSRIENKILILVVIIAAILFGLLWFGLWKVRAIVSTGSETVGNIMSTVKSLEKVLEKINNSEQPAK